MSNSLDTAIPVNHRILVVDDNPSIQEDFRKILCPSASVTIDALRGMEAELFGAEPAETPLATFEMDSALQGQEALAKVKAAQAEGRPYSMAYVDIRMPPGWDGVETIAQIWKEHPEIQVVICTAYSDYSWEEIIRKLGESDNLVILKKPFDNVEVLQLAHSLTKKWAVTRQANSRMAELDAMVERRTRELRNANQHLEAEVERRKHVEASLRDSEERFRVAFETVPVALAILGAQDSRFLDVNRSFIQLSGNSREGILGRTPSELGLLQDSGTALLESARSGQVREVELELSRMDGDKRQIVISIDSVVLGDHSCLLAALVDVTEHKHLESQLRHAQKMEAVGQLAAGVAHDFNNLLTVIHGYASLQLANANLGYEVSRAFQEIKEASERASALTRQLLAFSRKQMMERKRLDVKTVVNNLRTMLGRLVGETIQLECHAADNLPSINADVSSIEQVLMNLVVNARDAMPQGGKICITAGATVLATPDLACNASRRAGSFIVLRVADDGSGMDEATMARIFEPFFTTKGVGKGTGLGLSTVYAIADQHDGWVEVESAPGKGSTFAIYLPVLAAVEAPAAAEPSAPSAKAPEIVNPADVTIFVVEDEVGVRKLVVRALDRSGFKVVEASSGPEAISLSKTVAAGANLMLTDMVMPGGMSGGVLASQLMAGNPKLKVVYTSGYSPETLARSEALEEGLNFLPKPFTRDQLVATISNALRSSSPRTQTIIADEQEEGAAGQAG